MSAENGLFSRLVSRMGEGGRVRLVTAAGLLGILLIFAGGLLGEKKTAAPPAPDRSRADEAAQLEERLAAILSQVQGVGRAEVLITLEAGERTVYAVNEQTSGSRSESGSGGSPDRREETSSSQQSYLLIDGAAGKEPLVLVREGETVRGVVVVCEGGRDAVVRTRVLDAVTTALGVASNRVCVLQSGP